MHVNFLPHCNRQALVQISCPTQRKIFSAVSQLLSPVMLFYFFSLSLGGFTGENGEREGRRREKEEREEQKSSQPGYVES